ncbi:MAG: DoxX family protein [Gemmatimonadaceae bacterium]|nr:DoxX family protein [Gemmatimonadaceae bacterium]
MRPDRNIYLLSLLFIVAGAMHFVIPDSYARIMPSWIPGPVALVYVTGVLEIAGALALLHPRLRRLAGACLVALLVAVFPANVQMLVNAITGGASSLQIALLWARLPLQPLLIYWVFRAAIHRPFASGS